MIHSDRIPIESANGCTIYGRIVNPITKKLGQFEVIHDFWGGEGYYYSTYADAEKEMKRLVGKKTA